jgi:hypothetical protein
MQAVPEIALRLLVRASVAVPAGAIWGHTLLGVAASRGVVHGKTAWGARKRFAPVGGAAYGSARNARVLPSTLPRTTPLAVVTSKRGPASPPASPFLAGESTKLPPVSLFVPESPDPTPESVLGEPLALSLLQAGRPATSATNAAMDPRPAPPRTPRRKSEGKECMRASGRVNSPPAGGASMVNPCPDSATESRRLAPPGSGNEALNAYPAAP